VLFAKESRSLSISKVPVTSQLLSHLHSFIVHEGLKCPNGADCKGTGALVFTPPDPKKDKAKTFCSDCHGFRHCKVPEFASPVWRCKPCAFERCKNCVLVKGPDSPPRTGTFTVKKKQIVVTLHDSRIVYTDPAKSGKVTGGFAFSNSYPHLLVVRKLEQTKKIPDHCFVVRHIGKDTSAILQASSAEECTQWMADIDLRMHKVGHVAEAMRASAHPICSVQWLKEQVASAQVAVDSARGAKKWTVAEEAQADVAQFQLRLQQSEVWMSMLRMRVHRTRAWEEKYAAAGDFESLSGLDKKIQAMLKPLTYLCMEPGQAEEAASAAQTGKLPVLRCHLFLKREHDFAFILQDLCNRNGFCTRIILHIV
jgi:hypothetical protein